MQLLLIIGIAFAIAAVTFALQNHAPVSVAFALWRFDGSLAIVLLLAIGLGALIAGLVSSPAVIKGQWSAARMRRRIADLESENAELARRQAEFSAQIARLDPLPQIAPEEPKPYVGLTTLLTGGAKDAP